MPPVDDLQNIKQIGLPITVRKIAFLSLQGKNNAEDMLGCSLNLQT